MRFRITLTNPVLGSLLLTKMPKGVESINPTILRSPNHGLTIETDVKLEFYCNGAGKEFVDEVRDTQGIDAEILITIEAFCGCDPSTEAPDYSIDFSDDYGSMVGGDCDEGFEDFYLGELELNTWDTKDGLTKVNIKPRGILETVKNRLDTKIDLQAMESLDGDVFEDTFNTPYDLTLHGKTIIQTGELEYVENPDTIEIGGDVGIIPAGWEQVGEDIDSLAIPFEFADPAREVTHSYSQTTIPGEIIINEVEVFSEDLNTIARDDNFPATDIQFQSENLYTISNSGSDVYNIDVAFRFAHVIYLKVTNLLIDAGDKIFICDYTVSCYLSIGSTIYQLGSTYSNLIETTFSPETEGTFAWGIVPFEEFSFAETFTGVTINDGEEIKLYVKIGTNSSIERPATPLSSYSIDVYVNTFTHSDFGYGQKSFFNITQTSTVPETTSKAFAIFETGAQIARCIVGENDSFRSNIFGRVNSEPYQYEENGCGSFNAITNGFMIRSYPLTERTVRLSMNDYFKGLNPIWNLGMGIEKAGSDYYIVVDSKEYFYDVDTVLMTINNIPHLLRYESPEHYYNIILSGYEKWQIELINGLEEPNSKREYYTGIKAVDNKLDLVSPLVASAYRIEVARRNQYRNTLTTDSEFDEDNYIIALNRTEVDGVPTQLDVAEKNENFADVTDLLSPETSYNLRLTPNRNILRWGNVINAGLTKYTGREIKFTSGEGNYKMTSQFDADTCPGNWNNEVLSEGQNIQWDDANNTFSDPIWIPEILEFEWPVKFSEFKTIEANPKGVFSISESETGHIKGFILEFKYVPNGRSKFKLLRAFE
jgi:hypothetical protein